MSAAVVRRERAIARVVVGLSLAGGTGLVVLVDALLGRPVAITAAANLAVGAALIEFNRLAQACGAKPFAVTSLGGAALVLNGPWLIEATYRAAPTGAVGRLIAAVDGAWGSAEVAVLVIVAAGVLVQHLYARQRSDAAFRQAGATLMGIAYLALPMSLFLLYLWRLGAGAWGCLVWLVATARIGDIAACTLGHLLGRHKLAPGTSPNKTVEGALAGLITSVLVSVVLGWALFGFPALPAAAVGAVVAVAAQGGDLLESALKRSAGAKDSGSFLAAFGGALDVMDSVVLSLPAGVLAMQVWLGAVARLRGI